VNRWERILARRNPPLAAIEGDYLINGVPPFSLVVSAAGNRSLKVMGHVVMRPSWWLRSCRCTEARPAKIFWRSTPEPCRARAGRESESHRKRRNPGIRCFRVESWQASRREIPYRALRIYPTNRALGVRTRPEQLGAMRAGTPARPCPAIAQGH
jgi:hypothetical protein